jgi:hypothetical protein
VPRIGTPNAALTVSCVRVIKQLNIFEGYSFGIVSDVAQTSKAEAKDKAHLMAFILKACGADVVYEVGLACLCCQFFSSSQLT